MEGEDDAPEPWAGADDPEIIAAIGAEFERINGAHGRPEQDPFGGFMMLPLASMDDFLALLREMPSEIGATELAARLRERFGGLRVLKAVDPEQDTEDGA